MWHWLSDKQKRFKDVVDARILEEQARQKVGAQASASSSPRNSTSRSGSRTLSPSKRRPKKEQDADKAPITGKGPDPSEFEPEFVIGEDGDTPSRAGTPAQSSSVDGDRDAATSTASAKENGSGTTEQKEEDATTSTRQLPIEVRQKLKKLERLEPKYSGG